MKKAIKYLILNSIGLSGIIAIGLIANKYPEWAGTTIGSFIGLTGIVAFGFPIYFAWRTFG